MTEDANRRRHARADIVLKVEYEHASDLLHDYVTNLGEGGVFIATELSLNSGDQLVFALSFPGLLAPITVAGVVRWRREETTDEGPPGVGVEFVFDNEETRDQLRALLTQVREASHQNWEHDRPFNVLLVEDNEFVQEMFGYAVQRFHYERKIEAVLELYQTTNGQEALEILETTPIDLAIIDHFLPGITGSDLVGRLRADPRHVNLPVLVLSVGGDNVRRDALSKGANLFLDKPVMLRQLLMTIDALLPHFRTESSR